MLPRHAFAAIAASTATAALFAGAAAAEAATRTVHAGPPPAQAAKLPEGATGNAFYPLATTLKKGDKVSFRFAGFHNVVFAPKGQKPAPFHAPDATRPVAGTGAWYDGQPGWWIDMASVAPSGDKVIDGKALDGSGIFQGPGAPPPYELSFPKAGTYEYLCTIHKGMNGEVRVIKRGRAPSKAKHAKAAKREAEATVKLARKQARQEAPETNVVLAGNDRNEVAFLSFFPGEKRVAPGQSVKFELPKGSREIHNVVFGPADQLEAAAGGFIAIGPAGIGYDAKSVYPGGALAHVADTFFGTGLLDADASTPFPRSKSISFGSPGRFDYICTVHGLAMKGTVEVGS